MKRIAVISVTERGRMLSERIKKQLQMYEIRRFCFHKYADENSEKYNDLALLTAQIFSQYDAMIFISACGIAVRMIAPHVCSKLCDPAVIAVDDRGQYAIPLLSGHLGGANGLAKLLADALNAEAVITTATDIGGLFSPDSFAAANHLLIDNMHAAKEIAAAVLKGEKIGFYCDYPYKNLPPELTKNGNVRCGIVISDAALDSPFPITLKLIPKNIVIGIGCKKGVSSEQIENVVRNVFADCKLNPKRICNAASIDLKAKEAGLLQFCNQFGIILQTFSAEELMRITGDFSHSDFAETITGADNICERSAVLCSGGKLIIRKNAGNGVTVAAAEMPVEIDFEKRLF